MWYNVSGQLPDGSIFWSSDGNFRTLDGIKVIIEDTDDCTTWSTIEGKYIWKVGWGYDPVKKATVKREYGWTYCIVSRKFFPPSNAIKEDEFDLKKAQRMARRTIGIILGVGALLSCFGGFGPPWLQAVTKVTGHIDKLHIPED